VAEAKRLSFAWRMRLQCLFNARRFKSRANYLNFLLILFILLSTVAAVWVTYIDLHGELFPFESPIWKKWLDHSTLLLPLIATILRGLISILNPYGKYVALQNACCSLESEIYRYRCKVGKYSSFRQRAVPVLLSTKKDKDGEPELQAPPPKPKLPREHFSETLDGIWRNLAASDISSGSLTVPPVNADPMADINKRIRRNKGKQRGFLEPLVDKMLENDAARAFEEAEEEREENKGVLATCCRRLYRGCMRAKLWLSRSYGSSEDTTDYGISAMTVDDYILKRMAPVMAEMTTQTPGLSKRSILYTVFAMCLSVSASALSTFDQTVFIPVALAIAGAIGSWDNYNQVDLRLAVTNAAIHNLSEVRGEPMPAVGCMIYYHFKCMSSAYHIL
jgi:hypothetical protein